MNADNNTRIIMRYLKEQNEMYPDQHDGCYELMRETIKAYSRLKDFSNLDYRDLNLVYLTTVGTFRQGVKSKKDLIRKSHLLSDDIENLIMLWDTVWNKASHGAYENNEPTAKEGYSVGLFGTGFFSFKGSVTQEQTTSFIKMCIDISHMTDDDKMFERCAETLSQPIQGMQAAAASMILHVLKPFSFPILNANTGNRNIFELMGVQLVKPNKLETYIENCRRIKAFRDQNFICRNYRIYDIAAQKYGNNEIGGSDNTQGVNAWLLTWNKDKWTWENYETVCKETKKGQTYRDSWSCISKNPKIGEEVFLIKLGKSPRGIIGHGRVIRTQYETHHYDAEKARDGKKEKAIDVEFDRIIDFQKESIITQEELIHKCAEQHWSPQSSGIEIKHDVLQTLHRLWNSVIDGDEKNDNMTGMKAKVRFDHNMILYGPPGTGKTYNSINYAVAICDGRALQDVKEQPYKETLKRFSELKEKGRVVFTTFHQSYGYEEFIEGIRPVMANDETAGTLEYEIKDGIFKQICNAARIPEGLEIDHNTSIWFVSLKDGRLNDLKAECFRDGEIRFEGTKDLKGDSAWTYDRLTGMSRGDYVLSYGGGGDLIDAVGILQDDEPFFDDSRSSFRWVRKVKWLFTEKQISVKEINSNRLLPRFGIAKMNHMRLSDLLALVEENGGQRYRENENPYVFIIDEINRGNISKIFGELITLIEDTKREGASEAMEAILPYSGEPFSVPKNVYILGTMNTADRSIALMDTALRRRFEFVEMMPDPEVLQELKIGEINVKGCGKLDLATMLETINRRIEVLFDREHMIGHAFFTGLYQNVPIEELAKIFEKRIIPLLQEYFYEDYEKIQWVLGDNGKEDEYKFILDQPFRLKNVFKGTPGIDIPQEKIYTIQHDAFLKLESYLQIYE